jgi:Transglutaminase-like superfamily
MKFASFIFTLFFVLPILGQPKNEYASVDSRMAAIPDISAQSSASIARYIDSNFKKDEDKIRGVFYWVATNISYDVPKRFEKNNSETPQKRIENTIKSKKGVCMDYVLTFNEIASLLKIKCFFVGGYTKQNITINDLSHAWSAAKINNEWFVFDPTWGAGYVNNVTYTKKLNNYYFKMSPKESIKTHMPFDFLWQFSNYPVTFHDFNNGQLQENKSKPVFDYLEIIENQKNISYIDQLRTSIERTERNGAKNKLIDDYLENKKKELAVYYKNTDSVNLSKIVADFNRGIALFNDYVKYRNKQFKPNYADNEILYMIESPASIFEKCNKDLETLSKSESSDKNYITNLQKSISDISERVTKEKEFVVSYLKKSKADRPASFYVKKN